MEVQNASMETAMSKQASDPVKLRVRLTEELRQRLSAAAKDSLRSLNSEILYRLRASFERDQAVA
jgi:predicted HicB family RNase H-like nuclease